MKLRTFLDRLHEALEIDGPLLQTETVFADLQEWDSMAAMTMIALVDEIFDARLTSLELAKIKTVENLIEFIGAEKFH